MHLDGRQAFVWPLTMTCECGGHLRRDVGIVCVRYFLSVKEYGLWWIHIQQYLGVLCDPNTATFHAPQDKPNKPHDIVHTALDAGGTSFCTKECVAGECCA